MCEIAGNLYFGIIALILFPQKTRSQKIQENLNTHDIFLETEPEKKGLG